ncbi:helix-turn-helix transcriptional regulator [Escherichia coli]|uniref:helix-turn-helix transcriptional regulator n=1 Tax=Escherichia coli TaxID=562 RepID=UPI000B48D599|nr:AlpA family transcriptional regulator [Escherichia coli]
MTTSAENTTRPLFFRCRCEKLTGLSRTCRYRLEKAGQFPSRRKLGGRSVGWSLSEVLAWKDSCKAVH